MPLQQDIYDKSHQSVVSPSTLTVCCSCAVTGKQETTDPTPLGSSGEQKDSSAESRDREESGGVDPGNLEAGPPHVPEHVRPQGQELDAT